MTARLLVNAAWGAGLWSLWATALVLILARRRAVLRRTVCRLALAGVPLVLAAAAALSYYRPDAGMFHQQLTAPQPWSPLAASRSSGFDAAPPHRDPPGEHRLHHDHPDADLADTDVPPPPPEHPWTIPAALERNIPANPAVAQAALAPAPAARLPWPTVTAAAVVAVSMALLGLLAWRAAQLARWRKTWQLAPPAWLSLTRRLAQRVGLRTPFAVRVARGLSEPAAAGVLRPAIVLPAIQAGEIGPGLRGALTHELGHLAGRDPLWRMLGRLAVALAWWCPLVWYLARRERIESELTADDRALDSGVRPRDLANVLAWFAQRASTPHPAGLPGVACHVRRRIEMILDKSKPHGSNMGRRWRWGLALTGCLVAAWILMTPLLGVSLAEDGRREGEAKPRREGGDR